MSRVDHQNTYEVDSAVAELAAEQWSVLDLDELRGCGLTPNMIASRRRSSHLHLVHRGVYAVGHPALCMRGRFLAAVKAARPNAALSQFSLAALWGLLGYDEERPVDVTVPTRGTRLIPGVTVHRTRRPFEVMLLDRIPVMTPARALIDLSSVLPFKPLRRAVREGFALKRVTAKELLGHTKALDRILAEGYTPTRTELEDAVLDLITDAGFTTPDVNRTILVGGRAVQPDFRWPEQKLVIEADGAQWHDHRLAREDDAERQACLEAAGERVVRVTWQQAVTDPTQTLARIQAAGAPRRVQ